MSTYRLVFNGLSELDAEELVEDAKGDVEIAKSEVPDGALGEPATIAAIVTLTPLAIGALALWLSKGRRKNVLVEKVSLVHPDGTVEKRYFKVVASSEDEAKKETAKEIGDWIAEAKKNQSKTE